MSSELGVHPITLDDYLRRLWPQPCSIARTRGFARPQKGAVDYLVLPSPTHPQVLVPRSPRHITALTLRNYNTGLSGNAQLKTRLVSSAARAGLAKLLPTRIRIDDSQADAGSSIRKHLAETLGREFYLGIYLGSARAVRKPVLQLMTSDGATFAFAKVGVEPSTRALVRQEATNLTSVKEGLDARNSRSLIIPALLHTGPWRGHELLIQKALANESSSAPSQESLVAAMREISACFGITHAALHASSYLATLHDRIDSLPSGSNSNLLRTALSTIAQLNTDLQFGSWHGDFAPWNMTAGTGGRLKVWDWEHLSRDVPLGFDAIHYSVQRDVASRGVEPCAAFARASRNIGEALTRFDVTEEAASITFALYILEIATRYLEDDEPVHGTALGSLGWLEPTLKLALSNMRFAANNG